MGDRLKVFGIDIVRGSVRSRSRRPRYALIRREGDVVYAEDEVSAFRLFRLLFSEKPDILAIDSIQEIAADQHELFAFLQALPPSTRLVQVTGGERKESLAKVASRYNISFSRTDPFDEARTAALVASLGAGAEVIAFENECEVVVSRHRSPGKGGWSQNRYVRKIHGAVMQRAREIEMELHTASLRFQKKEIRAFGGFSRVVFSVAASRDQIPVGTYRGADVQVRVSGKRLERIRFRPLSAKPRYLIAGIDPGTTTAVAALDLDGNLLHLSSSRQTSMSDVVESLYKVGKPLIIASDVREMPFSVEKIRRAFNAVAYSPKQDLAVEAKLAIAGSYDYQNDHERDALSAALDAFRQYRNKFQNVVKRVPPGHDLDEVRAGIIRGQRLEQVLGDLRVREEPVPAEKPVSGDDRKSDDRVRSLDGTVKRLRAYISELQEGLLEKDREIGRIQVRLRKIRSSEEQKLRNNAEITKRDAIIQSLKFRLQQERRSNRYLRRRIERMKTIDELIVAGESVPVKVLSSFTREGLKDLADDTGIFPGDVIYAERIEGAGRGVVKELADAGVTCVIVPENSLKPGNQNLMTSFFELHLPLVSAQSSGVLIRGKSGLVPRTTLDHALFEREEEQKEYDREQQSRMIEDLFLEYRAERGKEIKKYG